MYREGLQQLAVNAVLLFRPLHMEDLVAADVLEGTCFIYSQWSGYLADETSQKWLHWLHWLQDAGIEMHHIHTSGHASPSDLQRFARALNPARLVPIHSFSPEKYPQQFDNVQFRDDGE